MQSTFHSFNQSTFNRESVNSKLKEVPEKCLVYLKLKFGNQVKSTIVCIRVYSKLKIYEKYK